MSASEERIDAGADVIGSDGDKVGTLAYVVVHPQQMRVTDYVVSTGFLGRDVVVPEGSIDHLGDGKVYLSIDQDAMKKLDDYVEVHYQTPPASWGPPTGSYMYPAGSMLWPASTTGYYPEPSSVEVNAPAGTVGLSEGMAVESSDGHKVGSIKGFDADPSSNAITDLIIKEGMLFGHEERIPVSLVNTVEEGSVYLNVTRDELTNHETDAGE